MTSEQALKENFNCSKCHNRACAVSHLSISHSLLGIRNGSYLAVTCSLCGFTELYDQAIYEGLAETENGPAQAAKNQSGELGPAG